MLVGKLGPYCNDEWRPGEIIKCVSSVTYLVRVDQKFMYKHVNSIRKILNEPLSDAAPNLQNVLYNLPTILPSTSPTPDTIARPVVSSAIALENELKLLTNSLRDMQNESSVLTPLPFKEPEVPQLRRSVRLRQPPKNWIYKLKIVHYFEENGKCYISCKLVAL